MEATPQSTFDGFIGIDWSGAQWPYKGLKVAGCQPGESVPEVISPAEGKYWRREGLVSWLIEEANRRRILIGADFGFAYPYCDKNAYFPGYPESPKSALALWQTIDATCHGSPDFYAGPFYKDPVAPFSDYLCYQTYRGSNFDNSRLRRTEEACRLVGTRPACVFKCVGADQVGSGSAAGMRALHFLATNHTQILSIWPFDDLSEDRSALVEIFPRLFFILAQKDPRQWRNVDTLNAVLRHLRSKQLPEGTVISSEDEADAIISVAALRGLSLNNDVWCSHSLDEETRRCEGWIFGCMQ